MRILLFTLTVALLLPAATLAQLPSEFALLGCKPSLHDSPDLVIEKTGRNWLLSVQAAEAKKPILQSAVPISNAQRAIDVGFVVYFLANSKSPKDSGWFLHRLSDGKSVQIAEAALPPISACITPDGRKLAYVTQRLGAVQIELAPAYERFRYWDDPAPKDHVVVPTPTDG